MKYKINRWWIYGLFSSGLMLILAACGLTWGWKDGSTEKPLIVENYNVKAGEDINMKINFKAESTSDNLVEKAVIAVQVPSSWNPRDQGVIEMTLENVSKEPGVLLPMRMLNVDESPEKKPGTSWEQTLLLKFNDENPNVLDDMRWVAFVSDGIPLLNNHWNFSANIKIKTGEQNLKAKIGICVYRWSEGGKDNEIGTSTGDYYHEIHRWTDCFEVSEGEGELIDFCNYHFNRATPGKSTQNDITTISFYGTIADNDLLKRTDIYLNAVATTTAGNTYSRDERNVDTKMMRDSEYSYTFSKTFWPEGYFGIPANEVIEKIEYYFTNEDGTLYVSKYDDNRKDAENPPPAPSPKPIEPFLFILEQ